MPLATRFALGQELISLAEENDFLLLNVDTKAVGLESFGTLFPGREYNLGIAEQCMMAAAAGAASCGNKVYVVSYSVFASMRACEQVRSFICYPNLDVTIISSHAGLQVGSDGATHMATEDVSIMRSFPNLTILQPSDEICARAIAKASVKFHGPLYIKVHKSPIPLVNTPEDYTYEIGKANKICDFGNDIAIFATGVMVSKSLEASKILKQKGINAYLLDFHTLKPLDEKTILEAAQRCGCVLTVEDHTILGGLGGATAEILGENYPVRMKRIGLRDVFGESGDPEDLYEKYNMSVNDIVSAAEVLVKQK
ncbi:transketolase family protein [Aminivibrio sp.]|jgi:transketolase|uniref:transketolase family protein n=1 Tax=Aminivibrio sp. TaxID=1872489 RepID=UPI003D9810FC